MYYVVFDQLLYSRIWQKVRKGRGHTISDRSPDFGYWGGYVRVIHVYGHRVHTETPKKDRTKQVLRTPEWLFLMTGTFSGMGLWISSFRSPCLWIRL